MGHTINKHTYPYNEKIMAQNPGETMKIYAAFLFQVIIWSGFTLAEWLSERDPFIFKIAMFAVFFYLAFLMAKHIVKSVRTTCMVTALSLSAYGLLQLFLIPLIF
ncbi:hypothetical protein BpJC7_21390 [Weizmannia acidilactici]|uniref:Uncharacterized protein n=2 Tax=Weizmannia acidilactici TaxID=2607726 RepID=A0A5J4J7D5_9BACI|nr:hypothetical protein BpJC4_29160 [Weizmannia acidilactici]GER70836.1 hypothetical protein BpJC7_21390 [Weizmannia acidilactici]GER74955.1 hypothetical protein BpPP18_30220 [Weizmannia acidilactici]